MSFPASVSQHHRNIRALPCAVCDQRPVTLHHCHSGSVSQRLADLGLDPMQTGRGAAGSEALVIPLTARYHVGQDGIDYGVGALTWELRFGKQADMLDEVGSVLGYSLWELHKLWLHGTKTNCKNSSSPG